VTDHDAELRRTVAAEHGLSHDAARLLTGETLDELEASAVQLAKLFGRRDEQKPETTWSFADLLAAKAERKRALTDLFTGWRPQPRDEAVRFSGFAGGARRQPAPLSRDPEREHGELLGTMISLSRTFRGGA
jgi:hypothetical protein